MSKCKNKSEGLGQFKLYNLKNSLIGEKLLRREKKILGYSRQRMSGSERRA